MSFDVKQLTEFAVEAIKEFAEEHQNETFYGFAVDASMLCLNSEECAADTLKEYRDNWDRQTRHLDSMEEMTDADHRDEEFLLGFAERHEDLDRKDEQACLKVINESRERSRRKGCKYRTDEGIRDLRNNTGDWAYQGFVDLDEDNGFDHELYDDHYYEAGESEDGHAPNSEYAKAMTALVEQLIQRDAFAPLKRADDFTARWVDHDY